MAHLVDGRRLQYSWRYAGQWNSLAVETAGDPALASPGSLEEFITEHYWGYTKQRDGGCMEYRMSLRYRG